MVNDPTGMHLPHKFNLPKRQGSRKTGKQSAAIIVSNQKHSSIKESDSFLFFLPFLLLDLQLSQLSIFITCFYYRPDIRTPYSVKIIEVALYVACIPLSRLPACVLILQF